MLGKQHLIYGVTTASAVAVFIYPHPVSLVAGAAIGSLFPDIDTPDSWISKQFTILSRILNGFVKHRTYTHDPVLWVPLGIALSLRFPWLWGFFIGIWSHLFLDSLTAAGIPMGYLWNKKKFHTLPRFCKFRSGGFAASVVTLFSCIYTSIGIGLIGQIIQTYLETSL